MKEIWSFEVGVLLCEEHPTTSFLGLPSPFNPRLCVSILQAALTLLSLDLSAFESIFLRNHASKKLQKF